jgi:SAM-dependent methyltransferase
MGDVNQLIFVKSYSRIVKGPVLEIGSKDYGNTQDFRSLFPDLEYIGSDMQAGKGVDKVLDFTKDLEVIDENLDHKRFGTIFCMSVLEHCIDPFKMARNIQSLMKDDGVLLVSVPFVWEVHGFPNDYWRFTPNGVRALFPDLDFDAHDGSAWTSRDGESSKLDDELFRVKFSSKRKPTDRKIGYIASLIASVFKKLGVMKPIFGYRYIYPPVMISMVGKKKNISIS